jgi:hypothetical protein
MFRNYVKDTAVSKGARNIKAGSVVRPFCVIPPAVCMLRVCVSSQEIGQTQSLVYEVSSSLSKTWGHVQLPKANHMETTKRKI